MTTLRWGVLGAANIAKKQVIPAIQASNNGRVVAIASRDKARAEQVAQSASISNVFDDYAALLASPDVDAVYIPLPNSEHRRWTIAAAEAGKHILCEKPIGLNAQEAEEMASAAERANVRLAEAFMYRHHPLIHMLLDMLHQGVIGDIRLIRSTFSFGMVDENNIRMSKELGGGALMDVGCYGVNLARLVTGAEPTGVTAIAEYGSSGVDEAFIGVMRFPKGVLAEFDVSLRASGGTSFELIGTTGKIVVRQGFKPSADEEGEIQLHQNGDISRIFTDSVDQYRVMVEEFAKAVIAEKSVQYPPQDAINNMRVLDMLRAAGEQGRATQ